MSRTITHIVAHCTAGRAQQKTSEIFTYWARKLGWKSYGYHWLINEDGTAEQITPDDQVCNGVKGYNANALHICYKGGWNGTDTRTDKQKEKMLELFTHYRKLHPIAWYGGHRDLSPDLNRNGIVDKNEWVKLCPCFDAKEEYKNII